MPEKPTTHQGDLAKLPKALAPLIERPQWCVWRWTQQGKGRWQKPPFQALDPGRHASTKDLGTWCDYASALAAVQAGKADGISYVLTAEDSFAAIDLDHCRDGQLRSIDVWAQNFLDVARTTYAEVTPSGEGIRIWGLAGDGAEPVNKKFTLEIDGKPSAAELFRRAPKALTITGLKLVAVRELANLDKAFQWAIVWGERRKAAAAKAAEAATQINGHSFNGGGGYDVDQIERLVRESATDGANRSDMFHAVVGHYVGCGWGIEQIDAHLRQFPEGIGGRYLGEGRLSREIARSAGKYQARSLPLVDGWKAPDAAVEAPALKTPGPGDDELDEPASPAEDDPGDELPESPRPETPDPGRDSEPADDGLDESPAQDPSVGRDKPVPPAAPDPDDDPELEGDDDDPELQDGDLGEQLYLHWDKRPGPAKKWLVKHLVPEIGTGLISGQNGTYKSFIALDLLVASLATGQPFLGHPVKRQCGGMLIAAEGADEMELRLGAVIREKCGGLDPVPFSCWHEKIPILLHKDATKDIIERARRVDAAMQQEFGLPLGLIVIDTLTACAGYRQAGEGNDAAVGGAIMGVLRAVAQAIGCFVFVIDHLGKNVEAGTRGTGAKEDAADVVWVLLGQKSLNGVVSNIRLGIRKHRGGKHGQEYPFAMREVAAPELDEDGEPETTLIVDWQPAGAPGGTKPAPDPWAECRRQDQRTAVLRLKRVLMDILADQGVDLPIPPDGPTVRMIDQEIVREQFYSHTPVEGDAKQKRQLRFQQFKRALGWAEDQQLIGVEEIDDVTYLRLSRPKQEEEPC